MSGFQIGISTSEIDAIQGIAAYPIYNGSKLVNAHVTRSTPEDGTSLVYDEASSQLVYQAITTQGPRGPTGPTGVSGSITGPTGPTGANINPTGPQGPTGIQGATGPTLAVTGPTGIIGPTGSGFGVTGIITATTGTVIVYTPDNLLQSSSIRAVNKTILTGVCSRTLTPTNEAYILKPTESGSMVVVSSVNVPGIGLPFSIFSNGEGRYYSAGYFNNGGSGTLEANNPIFGPVFSTQGNFFSSTDQLFLQDIYGPTSYDTAFARVVYSADLQKYLIVGCAYGWTAG
jgi:hypothetical protein